MSKHNIFKKKAFVLSEVLLAIAVIIIVGICVYPLYASNRDKTRIMHEVGFITELNTSIDKYYGAYHKLTDVSNTMLISQGLMPSNTIYQNDDSSTGVVLNIWNGTIEIYPDTQDSDKSKYIIVYRDLPSYACISLPQEVRNQYSLISVGGTYGEGTYSGGSIVKDNDQIVTDDLVTACTKAVSTDVAFVK